MSYCRFSSKTYKPYPEVNITIPKSDVYIFWGAGGLECCGCKIEGNYSSRVFGGYSGMIKHLKEHIKIGHTVPDHVIPMLEEELENSAKKDEK